MVVEGAVWDDDTGPCAEPIPSLERSSVGFGVDHKARCQPEEEASDKGYVCARKPDPILASVEYLVKLDDQRSPEETSQDGDGQVGVEHRPGPPLEDDDVGSPSREIDQVPEDI
jgi:hypothetical protein